MRMSDAAFVSAFKRRALKLAALGLAALGVAATASGASDARADAVADFYKGRNITLIMSFGGGGTYDAVARTISIHMPRHIPGNPTIVPRHMPGAGHVLATNFLYNQAPRDGSHLGTIGNSIPLHQIIDGKGVRFDAREFLWLGSTGISNLMTVALVSSGIKSIDDVYRREVTAGSTGAGSGTMLYPTVANKVLGTKFKVIAGYKRAPEIDLAMERGEVQVRSGFSYGSLLTEHPDWFNEKKVVILFQVGGVREETQPDVPLFTELAKTDEQRQILKLISSTVAIGRPYLTTPEVPADRLAALRAAFDATMTDPQFLAEAKRLEFDLRPMDHTALTMLVNDTIDAPAAIVEQTKAAMGGAGGE